MTGSASGPQVLTEEARLRTKRSSLIDQRIVFPSILGARHSQCAPIMKCLDRERGHVSSSMTRGAAQYSDGDGVLTFGLSLKQQQLCINNSSELCTVCPCVDIRLAQCVLTNICLQNMFSIPLLVSIMIMITPCLVGILLLPPEQVKELVQLRTSTIKSVSLPASPVTLP